MAAELRKYATATHIYVPMVKRGVVDYAVGADWTPAAGDVKVSIDGGAAANIATLPVAVAMGQTAYWDFAFSSGETTGKKIVCTVGDSATKAVEDQMITILTYGNASAEFASDFSASALAANVTQWEGSDLTAEGTFPRLGITDQGTTAAAPTNTTVDLRAACPFSADSTPVGMTLGVYGSTQGYWQFRTINAFTNTNKRCTVDGFTVTPTGTVTYIVFGTAPLSSAVTLSVNVSQINGSSTSATNLQKMTDGTGGVALTATFTGNLTGSVGSVANPVIVGTNNDKTGYTLSNAGAEALLGTQLTESYPAAGTVPTLEQSLLMLNQMLGNTVVSGATMDVYKIDGVTIAMSFTLNSAYPAQLPTSIARSS